MIRDRTSSYRDYNDLFSNLMAANENDSEGSKLTDEELTGNIFVFLIGEYLILTSDWLLTSFHSRTRDYCTHIGICDGIVGTIP